MPSTPHLALPLLAAAQAQKHVTHNEALALLDAVVHLAVREVRSGPPEAPTEGERHLVGENPTGAFAGHARKIALFDAGAWRFLEPKGGWRAYVAAAGALLVHDGQGWRDIAALVRSLDNLDRLGLGTSADSYNRLAVKLNGALFTALFGGEGGSGDLRFVLNKESAGNVVSQLYQRGWSGRAEVGLLGNDDFTVKVSGDGGSWHEAIRIRAETGEAAFPSGVAGMGGLRNLLLNPDFAVNQRGFAGGALAAGAYGFDRWKGGPGGCTLARGPDGAVTLNGALVQIIEGARVAGKPVTVAVENPSGPLAVDVAGASGTIPAGSGRRQVTLWPSDAGENAAVTLTGAGITFARPAAAIGTGAPPDEPMPPGLMLSLCQRYFEKSYDAPAAPGTAATAGLRLGRASAAGQLVVEALATRFAVRKRAIPAVTWYAPGGLAGRVRDSVAAVDLAVSGTSFAGEGSTGAPVLSSAPAAGNLLQAHWTADAEL